MRNAFTLTALSLHTVAVRVFALSVQHVPLQNRHDLDIAVDAWFRLYDPSGAQ